MMSDRVNESIQVALAELLNERARIDSAIAELEACLQSLGGGGSETIKGRTSTIQAVLMGHKAPRSRAGWTPEARQAAAERMRRYWLSRRNEEPGEQGPAGSEYNARKRSTKGWTAEARQAAAERMKRYWGSQKRDDEATNESM